MMKLYLSIVAALLAFNICSAQNINYVDRAPYSLKCGENLEKVFKCTETEIYEFMMQDLDYEACPATDTVARYELSFKVDSKGLIGQTSVNSDQGESPCQLYLKERAVLLGDHIQMKAAQLKNKRVEFNKKLNFVYPLDSIHTANYNSTGQYSIVEEMPRFVGCEQMLGSAKDKEMCAQYDMLMFIYKSLRYPSEARENGVQGMVVAQFVVDTTGQIQDVKIVREIGGGCGAAVIDVIDSMNSTFDNAPFVPGVQAGKRVKVLYTLPVKFRLEESKLFKKKKKKKKD